MLLTLPHPPPGVHEEPVDEHLAIRTIHAALDGGARLVDTAVNYCMQASEMGRSERLVAKALKSWGGEREDVLVVCKGGNRRTDDRPWGVVFKPEPDERPALLQDRRFYVPAYFGPSGWLALDFHARKSVDWSEVAELMQSSCRQVALKRMLEAL